MLAGSHRNAWPDETGTGGRTNRNTQKLSADDETSSATFRLNSGEYFFRVFLVVDGSNITFPFVESALPEY